MPDKNPFIEVEAPKEAAPATSFQQPSPAPKVPAASAEAPAIENHLLEGAIADTAGYVEVPHIDGGKTLITGDTFVGSAAFFAVLFLVMAETFRTKSFGKGVKRFEQLISDNRLISGLVALSFAVLAFRFPQKLVFSDTILLSGFQILSFLEALSGAAFALGLLAVTLSKKYNVLLRKPPLVFPGHVYLSLGLLALIASAAMFFWVTESTLSVWILCLTVFSYSYFSFAKLSLDEIEESMSGLFPFLAAFSVAMMGAALMWWPVLLFFVLIAGGALATARKAHGFNRTLKKALLA